MTWTCSGLRVPGCCQRDRNLQITVAQRWSYPPGRPHEGERTRGKNFWPTRSTNCLAGGAVCGAPCAVRGTHPASNLPNRHLVLAAHPKSVNTVGGAGLRARRLWLYSLSRLCTPHSLPRHRLESLCHRFKELFNVEFFNPAQCLRRALPGFLGVHRAPPTSHTGETPRPTKELFRSPVSTLRHPCSDVELQKCVAQEMHGS